MQKSAYRLLALLGLVLVFSLFASSCGNDDDSEPAASEPAASEPAASEASPTQTVELLQESASVLDAVRERGHVICGGNDALPFFGQVDDEGDYSGFDIDYCRVVAAAVLGDADAYEIVPLAAAERFTALQSGEIDVLIRNTTWTATRDGQEGVTFQFTTFYDGQGVMVHADSDFHTLEDLAGANVCVLSGTTTELNLTAVFNARGIPFNPLVFEDNNELTPAYLARQCDVMTTDSSGLAALKTTFEADGEGQHRILGEIISKEPLGPGTADGDDRWAQAVNWAVMATVQAWEFGLDSSNIASYSGNDPNILNFLGIDGFNPGLGLAEDFAVQAVSQVGNYEEIYRRHLDAVIPLDGSVNDLWSNGGLMYVPPYR